MEIWRWNNFDSTFRGFQTTTWLMREPNPTSSNVLQRLQALIKGFETVIGEKIVCTSGRAIFEKSIYGLFETSKLRTMDQNFPFSVGWAPKKLKISKQTFMDGMEPEDLERRSLKLEMDQQEKYLLILKVRPEEISIWSCSESLTFIWALYEDLKLEILGKFQIE